MRSVGLAVIAAVLTGCTSGQTASVGSPTPPVTACEHLIPACRAERLPDLVLSYSIPAPDGTQALGPISGSIDGMIGFDQALIRAWSEDSHADATTVQVVLGSADPNAMHWQTSDRLFYGVAWGGMIQCPIGGARPLPSPSPHPCGTGTVGTIIDAITGAFIVSG